MFTGNDRRNLDEDGLVTRELRWETFKNWPKTAKVKALDVWNGGLYYTGFMDFASCFECDVDLTFKASDNPWRLHVEYSPLC